MKDQETRKQASKIPIKSFIEKSKISRELSYISMNPI